MAVWWLLYDHASQRVWCHIVCMLNRHKLHVCKQVLSVSCTVALVWNQMCWRWCWQLTVVYEDITSTRAHGRQVWKKHLCEGGDIHGHQCTKYLSNAIVYSTSLRLPCDLSMMSTNQRFVPGCLGDRFNILGSGRAVKNREGLATLITWSTWSGRGVRGWGVYIPKCTKFLIERSTARTTDAHKIMTTQPECNHPLHPWCVNVTW